MLSLAYSVSAQLTTLLGEIEQHRTLLLTTPLARKHELRLRWEATIDRVYWSLALSEGQHTKQQIAHILGSPTIKKLPPQDKDVQAFKLALDHINQHWYVSSQPVTPKTLITLNAIAAHGTLHEPEPAVKRFLEYLQSQQEHPVIQAAIMHAQLLHSHLFTRGNKRTAILAAYLMLSKYGYDIRGLVILSDFWKKHTPQMMEVLTHTAKTENVTRWLELYAYALVENLKQARQDIASTKTHQDLPQGFWELNERQKTILTLLDQPGITFTNRQAQKLFSISQITASRDLSKLTILGLVFAHGKGRSVYYSKV